MFPTFCAITPLVKKLAIAIGATDKPDSRKVHQKIMPRLGGNLPLHQFHHRFFSVGADESRDITNHHWMYDYYYYRDLR